MRHALLVLCLVLGVGAQAAVVTLKGGGRLEGTVVSSDAGGLVIDTAQGRVRIPAERVQSVDYSPSAAPAPAPAPAPYQRPERRPLSDALFEPPSQFFSLGMGLAAPLSDVDFNGIGGGSASNGDVGPLISLQYLYRNSPRLDLGVEFDYANRSATDSPGLLASSLANVSGDDLIFLGVAKYHLTARGTARPYVLVGAGAHRSTTQIDAQPNPGFVWSDTQTDEPRRLVDGSAWGFASSARLGLDFELAEPWVFSLEAGWTGLASATYQSTPAGSNLGLSGVSGGISLFTLTARWAWGF